ncbi:MAG: Gfo/Idh/MocA family oxidoreductase [Lentisphaerae bacterium]|jgi:predicted dehydrogenase|nr:Gfo/Idh/MocA family oxidoreductase [Lentisphaerota bacterium]MBT5612605.1 Gfo/Idh/MocA family oxidoreductase [Lentisphaerota bacterium]MBT7059264.1 Gfo/Idh/MocA family oxidoreductase [Lentisphaerota bacterium]MBT7845805.1 Gfo/Idh/MocA family oxidoreductase [Lentisphaerota bacterium]
MSLRVGICGCGAFARSFIPLFNAHPLVGEVVLADLIRERADEQAAKHGIQRVLGSLDELCESNVDAIVLLTQRQLHGPQVVQALRAGKHVYSAVPTGQTLDQIEAIIKAVEETRLIYQIGETSYYYPCTLYCRDRYRKGDFGDVFYGEAHYFHDMSHFYQSFQRSGGADWKQVAGIPPMHYPTHSVSMMVSVTGARVASVSCLGWRDRTDDGVFKPEANLWRNVFSNESALMEADDGSTFQINEFRRVGWRGKSSVQMSLYGTEGCYEENADSQLWCTIEPNEMERLDELLACRKLPISEAQADVNSVVLQEFHCGASRVHPVERLPREFVGLGNGHLGSHQFLADDFVRAAVTNHLPPNHAWAAARYCAPGLVAHQSSEQGGARLEVPDFGNPPEDWPLLAP